MSLTQREAFARTMEHLCSHDGNAGHGYSQINRWGDGTYETVDLGDGVSVKLANGDRDCSSGIISALKAVGINTGNASYTGNMRSEIIGKNPTLFAWSQRTAQRGDIYLNESHHTAMCTSADPDMLCQFSVSENGTIRGTQGDQTGKESNFKAYYSYPWNGKIVWLNDGATLGNGTTTTTATTKTINDSLDVDGYGGPLTITKWQNACGTYADGIISGQLKANKDYLRNLWNVTYDNGSGSTMVRYLQKKFGIDQDGLFGPITAKKIQRHLQDSGYSVGSSGIDGYFGSDSTKALQRSLNDGGKIWGD